MSIRKITEELQSVVGEFEASEGVVASVQTDIFENTEAEMPCDNQTRIAGPGRPKGASNRRTLKMREIFLKSGFKHPMMFLGEIMSSNTKKLALSLDCDLYQAIDLQRKAAVDLLPYLESKMPTEVTMSEDDKLPVLIVGDVRDVLKDARLAGRKGEMAIDDDVMDAVEIHEAEQLLSRSKL